MSFVVAFLYCVLKFRQLLLFVTYMYFLLPYLRMLWWWAVLYHCILYLSTTIHAVYVLWIFHHHCHNQWQNQRQACAAPPPPSLNFFYVLLLMKENVLNSTSELQITTRKCEQIFLWATELWKSPRPHCEQKSTGFYSLFDSTFKMHFRFQCCRTK